MIRTLTADDFESLYAAFLSAFSDYVVPFALTREQLREMITRRGWVPELSAGAFEDGELVAFTINAAGGGVGYDSGTGVVPSHRRRGLGLQLMERSFELLREHGCHSYVLEVIESNTKAAELYRACGFRVVRRFQCWKFASGTEAVPPLLGQATIQPAFRDVEPSWQNSDASIARARDRHVILGDERGYAVVFPDSGDLAQLAVRHDSRRQGFGTRLLREAFKLAGKPLRILNVDDSSADVARFLESVGAERTIGQLEMVRPLR